MVSVLRYYDETRTFSVLQPTSFGVQNANAVLAGPTSGAAANPTFRVLNQLDMPQVPAFYAHKDLTDQTGLTTGAYNVITWPAIFFDTTSAFDTTNNRWGPPAGYVALHTSVWQSAHAASSATPTFVAKIRRFNTNILISNASPAVVTWNAHGLVAGQPIQFETAGTLPNPLVIDTVYYVISTGLTANTFEFSASHGGTAVNTTTNGTGPFTGLCDVGAGIGGALTGAPGQAVAHCTIQAAYSNGTDFFQVIYFYNSDDAGNDGVVNGNPAHTHFSGHWFGHL